MRLNAGVNYIGNGLKTSLTALQVQTSLMGIADENVNGFDKVGYQRKEAVVSAFTEYLGTKGISKVVDDKVGRITATTNPLDFVITTKGYFQTQSANGVKLTRDGRFKLNKNGDLLTLDGSKVLADNGSPIKFSIIPKEIKDIVLGAKGKLSVLNRRTNKLEKIANIGVVDSNGTIIMNPKIKQGYNEYSNVSLQEEFLGMMPILKNFDANRQIFLIESSNLSKTISQLGQG